MSYYIAMICCPVCLLPLTKIKMSFKCANKHNFDINKYGYLNLALSKGGRGDNLALINARHNFLQKNHYLFLAEEIKGIVEKLKVKKTLDLACGEGYYTEKLPSKHYGIDLSEYGLRIACKRDPLNQYILASIFKLPFAANSFEFILTCFAPLAKEEITRVLKKDGYFLFVTPGKYHLYELKKMLYPSLYLNKEKTIELKNFTKIKSYNIQKKVVLNKIDLINLFNMTPYAYKTKEEAKEKLLNCEKLAITFSFNLDLWQKD